MAPLVFVKDIGRGSRRLVRVQQNIVRENGLRLFLIERHQKRQRLDIWLSSTEFGEVLRYCSRGERPPGLKITELFDQSVFVVSSVRSVICEGAIAAGLTALMILLFLGSWRSTLIVMISIPLAILASLVVLYFLGETLNTMTLGGLALAIGILVDDSTVTIKIRIACSANRKCRFRKRRCMDLPALPCRPWYRRSPSVASSGLSSFSRDRQSICSRRSVLRWCSPCWPPTGCLGVDADYHRSAAQGGEHGPTEPTNWAARFHSAFERGFEGLREGYAKLLTLLLRRRLAVPAIAVLVLGLGAAMLALVGRDFFPLIDGGQIRLHVRAPAGTRIETTEQIFQAVEDKICEIIPESERSLIVDNIGLPARSYNLAFSDGSTTGANDGVILVSLKDGHRPTADYIRKLREVLPAAFPEDIFYFQAADIVTQILNFGLPSQIDVRTVGYDRATNLRVARDSAIARRDPRDRRCHLQQEVSAPAFYAMIDRARAAEFGLMPTPSPAASI